MLTAEGKRSLRAQAHHLKPVVLIGQHGVSDAVIAEIGIALDAHELIKIRFRGAEREAREADIARVCETLAAEYVAGIGGTAVLYRKRPEPKPKAKAKAKKKVKPRTRAGSVRNRSRGRDEV
jgi:RNA-binding protein